MRIYVFEESSGEGAVMPSMPIDPWATRESQILVERFPRFRRSQLYLELMKAKEVTKGDEGKAQFAVTSLCEIADAGNFSLEDAKLALIAHLQSSLEES
jgi:hypothetical protein